MGSKHLQVRTSRRPRDKSDLPAGEGSHSAAFDQELKIHNSQLITRFANQHILILGLAREGESLARFLARYAGRVTVTDRAEREKLEDRATRLESREPGSVPIHLVLGGDHPELVAGADAFFVSPGVPESSPVYRAALRAGLQPQSMTTLFFDLCPAPIVGITGSSGKTTTTSLIGHMLRTGGRETVVGGNIGDPMLDLLPAVTPQSTVVLELSSFQLSLTQRSPRVALITNISPNHLDRHPSMEDYIAAKKRIVAAQSESDFAVLNAADPVVAGFAGATRAAISWFGDQIPGNGATVRNGLIVLRRGAEIERVLPVSDVPLLGRHNLENVLAAVAVAGILDVPADTMAEAIKTFRAPRHRLETVGEVRGVRYVDDSIATSPARAAVALQAIDGRILLIAGGRDKKLPWEEFAALAARRTSALFLIGEAADQIDAAVRRQTVNGGSLRADAIRHCASLEHAVEQAGSMAAPGDVVLLAPACTSYDMFRDYEERGDAFARVVSALERAS